LALRAKQVVNYRDPARNRGPVAFVAVLEGKTDLLLHKGELRTARVMPVAAGDARLGGLWRASGSQRIFDGFQQFGFVEAIWRSGHG
jgi:hypothetical protein